MARPEKHRRIHEPPLFTEFKPVGIGGRMIETIVMTIDEYEAIRLADHLGMKHEEAAEEMEISRPTFTRLLDSARRKTAEMIVTGKRLVIEGGNVRFRFMIVRCADCGHMFRTNINEIPQTCPVCASDKLILMSPPGGGHGFGHRHRHGGGPWHKGRKF